MGPVGIEWVFDGNIVWIVQLNSEDLQNRQSILDENIEWVEYRHAKSRLEDYRQKVMELRGTGKGIKVIGRASPFSHLGQIAEDNGVPVQFFQP